MDEPFSTLETQLKGTTTKNHSEKKMAIRLHEKKTSNLASRPDFQLRISPTHRTQKNRLGPPRDLGHRRVRSAPVSPFNLTINTVPRQSRAGSQMRSGSQRRAGSQMRAGSQIIDKLATPTSPKCIFQPPRPQHRARPQHRRMVTQPADLLKFTFDSQKRDWIRPRHEFVSEIFDEFTEEGNTPIGEPSRRFSPKGIETKRSTSSSNPQHTIMPTTAFELGQANLNRKRPPKPNLAPLNTTFYQKSLELLNTPKEEKKEKKEEKEEKKKHTLEVDIARLRKGSIRILPNVRPNAKLGKQLKRVPLLSRLPDKERAQLAGALVVEHYLQDDIVIQQGEIGKGFYIIREGRAIVQHNLNGKVKQVGLLQEGDFFGEAALLSNAARGASVIAQAPGLIVWFLDRKHFSSLFASGRFKRDVHFAKRHGVTEEKEEGEILYKKNSNSVVEKTPAQQKLIFSAIKDNVLFNGMEHYGILKMISKMWLVNVPKEARVVKQGEIGGNFFVVQKGKLNVYKNSHDGTQLNKCDKLGKKNIFGELSLMYNTPRTATVIAARPCSLWTLDRFTYRRILRNISSRKLRDYEQFLINVPLLAPLTARERAKISEAIEEEVFVRNDIIVKQAKNTEEEFGFASMYIIVSGEVKVEKTIDGKIFELRRLKKGNFFGERALLKNEPRSASVTCLTDVHVLKLDRQAVTLLLGPLGTVLDKRLKKYDHKDSRTIAKTNTTTTTTTTIITGATHEHSISTSASSRISHSFRSSIEMPEDTYYIKKRKPKMSDLVILGTLGKGSYGLVRLVRSKVTHETYALKAVSRSRIKKVKHQDHLLNEKRLLEKLHHPFLINLEGTFKDRQNLYYLLEPALGGELFTTLRTHTVFDNDTARFYAASVVLLFGHMHSQNIIFRDLKPENVLLDAQGYCKVTDFGFAKELNHEGRTYTLCGTPAYLSPEIVAGKPHGTSVDWWAMGVFIYELLSGQTPFRVRGEKMMQLYQRISKRMYKCPDYFSPNAKDIISKFLELKPTMRLGVIRGGVETIKQQPWFFGFDFDALEKRRMRPPIIPFIQDNSDMHHFAWFDDEDTNKTVGKDDGWEDYEEDTNSWDAEF